MEYHPEHQRATRQFSAEQLRDALDELDAKLDTLRRRVRATAADSQHTYHAHIATLERKRALLTEQVNAARSQTGESDGSVWQDIRSGIDTLRQDLKKMLD